MAGRSRHKQSMEHFTLFLPSSLLSEIREEVEQSGGTIADKVRSYIESGRRWEQKYLEKITEMVVADARDDLIEHDPGYLERSRSKRSRKR